MNIIEQLKYHEQNQLDEWIDLDEKATKKLAKAIVKFGKEDETALKQYCINTIPTEHSSLSIVYEAISEYTTSWNAFLGEEIKRIVTLAKNRQIPPEFLEVLTDIECEDIYSKDEDVYIDFINFMVSQLHINNDTKFTIELLDVLDWFLIELDKDDDIKEAEYWVNQITNLANNGEATVKLKAREVLKSIDIESSLNPLSLMEKLKSLFK